MANEREEEEQVLGEDDFDERKLKRCEDILEDPEKIVDSIGELISEEAEDEITESAVPKARKQNKIINNSYKNGTNLKGDEYKFESALKVDATYAGTYLDDVYDIEKYIVERRVQEEVMRYVSDTPMLSEMCSMNDEETKKFNKEKINLMFGMICRHFEASQDICRFYNIIYIFDNVSYLSGLRYHNLFDMLEDDHKQKLIIELDRTHGILRSHKKNNKLF